MTPVERKQPGPSRDGRFPIIMMSQAVSALAIPPYVSEMMDPSCMAQNLLLS